MPTGFSISREDWSLHRQGQSDQERHAEKVREAVKQNLPGLISNESIITTDGQKLIRVPIRALNEYRFRYNWDRQQRAGQGPGGTNSGDVIARESPVSDAPQPGADAGDQAGLDYYEAEISLDDLGDMIFEDLGLPNLDPRKQPDLTDTEIRWQDVRKQGLTANIDKKRSILEALKRNAMAGRGQIWPIKRPDMRYKTWQEQHDPITAAVVLAMMDTSGSMGEFEKYIARAAFYWMVRFLRTRYDNVEVVFIAHSTDAQVVSEEAFFTKGQSGGTKVSSAYDLALRLIADLYQPDRFNLYPFHFSDGDNLSTDNPRAVELARGLLEITNMFGYAEIDHRSPAKIYYRPTSLHAVFSREIRHPRFVSAVIKDKTEVYKALRTFFGPDRLAALGGAVG